MSVSNQIESNDNLKLTPETTYRDPVLKFDFPGLKVGIGEYEEGPTGCTVFRFTKTVKMTSDIRGGTPGVVGGYYRSPDAIVFAGGSLFGYEAFAGVTAELLRERGYKISWETIPVVAGAILYDFRPRPSNSVYPDKSLGRAALRSVKEGIFPLGNQGAGISATVGKFFNFSLSEKGGQGGAYRQYGSTKILVFSAVNSYGAIYDKKGNIIRGNYDREKGYRVNLAIYYNEKFEVKEQVSFGNTTLTLVVTNQKFNSYYNFQQAAKQIHVSMARAIHPFHIKDDGDVLFMVSTEEVENKHLNSNEFGLLASEVAWDAVLSCFEEE